MQCYVWQQKTDVEIGMEIDTEVECLRSGPNYPFYFHMQNTLTPSSSNP